MKRMGEHGSNDSGRQGTASAPRADSKAAHDAAPLVVLEDVHKSFGRQEVIRGIDLELRAGLITGLLGPSGCGKTTLINLMVGSLIATSGRITVLGKPAPPRSVRPEMGFMPQSEALYNDLTARENLRFFGSLYGLSGRQLEEAIPRVLDLVHLDDQGKKVVSSFSGGMKRRLSLAIALLHTPRLLILDEPTIGLDPLHRVELWKSFRALVSDGATMLITTHVMDEAALCDQIIMIHDGQIIARGSANEIIKEAGTTTLEEAFLQFETREAGNAPEATRPEGRRPHFGRKAQAPSRGSGKGAPDA